MPDASFFLRRFPGNRALMILAGLALAACAPPDYPDDPFNVTEQGMTAPKTLPLDSGFPGADDLAAAREVEMQAFGLTEEAEALAERSAALAERELARSDAGVLPPLPVPELEARQKSLRERAEELRARTDLETAQESPDLGSERENLSERARELRERQE
ncbi:MAG: hypothetical protein OIF40_11515 [Mangrovicoccus sp.]|nr:hypothetical protein [Mangrovicoccus sp.]